jgi:hypothetical protein
MPEFDPRYRNPLYTLYLEEWNANKDFAEMPLHALRAGDYLPRWGGKPQESENQYTNRKCMSAQFDPAPELVDIRVKELWRTNPERVFEKSPYAKQIEKFLANVDGGGTDMNTFMKRVTELMHVNGVDVLVDKEATSVEPNTLADENSQPFLSTFSPQDRPDWSTDHAGRYLFVRYDLGTDQRLDETFGVGDTSTYVTYTREGGRIHLSDGDVTATQEFTHNMGQVPVVQVYWGNSIQYTNEAIATSIMSQLSPLSQYMLKLSSQGQLDLFMTVAFFFGSGMSASDLPDGMGASMMITNTDAAADLKPVFANVNHIVEKREWLQYIWMLMLKKGKITGLSGTMDGTAQSGVQVAIEASPLHSELATTAGVLERAEVEIMRLAVSRMEGRPITTDELQYGVKYAKTFTLQSTSTLLGELKTLSEVDGIREFGEVMRVFMRKLANAIAIPGTPEHDKMLEEIKNFTAPEFDAINSNINDDSDA